MNVHIMNLIKKTILKSKMSTLSETTITFGKYNNRDLSDLLKDRNYCRWLKDQLWFRENYTYLYNRVVKYNPLSFFTTKPILKVYENFLEDYPYFYLKKSSELKIQLTDTEIHCYVYYKKIIRDLRDKIVHRKRNLEVNIYNIKAPSKWLKSFELETKLPSSMFKDFIKTYDLPNITTIVKDIKEFGGLEYKGSSAFLIAKKNSLEQEDWWKIKLEKKFGEDISSQFKYKNCFFDFLNIKTETIYECKLNLKSFNLQQFKKYTYTLEKYKLVYLISKDCAIYLEEKVILTTNPEFYEDYKRRILSKKTPTYLDMLIIPFKIVRTKEENLIL